VAQTNTIAAIGERDAYSYAATAGEVVSIRMTALGAGLDAQLELRDGASNLLASAASRIDRVLTNAETYLIIALDQGNNETGDYALVLQRVVNPCNSAAVSCGATAQASLDGAGEVNAWTFTAAAGDVMTFRLNVTNSASQFSPRLEIFDPLGRTVLASGSSFSGTLTNAGTYTLLVSYNSGTSRTGDYWLAAAKLNNGCGASAVNCSDLLTSSISAIEEIDTYTIPVPGGGAFTTVRLESLTANFTPTMELFDPLGRAVTSSSSSFTSNLTNVGNYTLLISHSLGASRTGDYRLALQRVVNPCAATSITCGNVAAGTVGVAGELDAFTIVSTGAEVFSLQLLSTNNSFLPQFDLYTPAGWTLTTSDTDFVGTFTNAGTYGVIVRASSGMTRTGNYWLSVERTANPCDAAALVCGTAAMSSVSALRETDAYTVAGGGFVLLRLESRTANFTPIMRLYNAAGALVTSSSGTILSNLAAGTHTLLVNHNSGSSWIGDYELAHQRIVNPCNAIPLTCGTVAAGGIGATEEYDAFTIEALGGQTVSIRLTSTNSALFNPRFDLYDPAGRLIGISSGLFTGVLSNAGAHTLLVSYDSGTSLTGNYWLAFERITALCNPVVLSCGTLTNGSLDDIGEIDVFSFQASGGEMIALNLTSPTGTFSPTMDLFDPTGRTLTSGFGVSEYGDVLTNAGVYTVLVRYGFGSRTGAYTLYLQNLTSPCATSGTITCGGLVSGLLQPDGLATYSFAAVAGDVVTVRLSSTSAPMPDWQIYEPDGNPLMPLGTTFTRNVTQSGNYIVLVLSPQGPPQIVDYVVSLNKVRDPCTAVPLVCGAVQAGAITEMGEIHAYTFTAASNEVVRLRIASMSEFFTPLFDLYDPDGELATGADDYSDLMPTLSKPGLYTVLVHWQGGADSRIGEYRLGFYRISSPCGSTPAAFGVTASGSLDEPVQTDIYTFTAGPGPLTICTSGSGMDVMPFMELVTAGGELTGDLGYAPFQPTLVSNGTYRLVVTSPDHQMGGYFIRFEPGLVACSNLDLARPSVTVLKPVAGELVPRGTNYIVTWTASDAGTIARQEILVSMNGGQTFTALDTNLAGNVRSHVWAVPAGVSAAGWQLRIVAIDAAGHMGSDETEGLFFVVNANDQHGAAYLYDTLNQLVFVSNPSGRASLYAYDPARNRIQHFGIADPGADTDGDGLPDYWEATHGFDPTNFTDGTADSDGDGLSNYGEYVACTDPFSIFSVFRITSMSVDPSVTRLSFRSRAGKTYVVEWTDNLTADVWTSLPPVTAAFSLTTVTNMAGAAGGPQFYRVRVVPAPPCETLP
jgi:YD repeat-containing protein